jgi:type II secretory pathway pseudopilin PulG
VTPDATYRRDGRRPLTPSPHNGLLHAQRREPDKRAHGASLVGLLLIVLALGVVSASAVVGLRSMTGSSRSSAGVLANAAATGNLANQTTGAATANVAPAPPAIACKVAADAAMSASRLYFANSGGKYPVKWSELTAATPPIYELASNAVINEANPNELDGPRWKLTMSGGGTTPPTFTCR